MFEIDTSFVNVDFTKCPEYTFGDLGRRGIDPVNFGAFEDSLPLIPRDRWQELSEKLQAEKSSLAYNVTRVYNQLQEGSCVGNSTAQAHEIMQARQFGEDRVTHLSAISLYKRIGRSPNSGSTLDDAYEEVLKRGIVPLDTPENRQRFNGIVMPNTGFYTEWPTNWEATARHFAGGEGQIIRSVDGLVTALLSGYPVVVGRQGHSICYVAIVFKNGRMYAVYVNSWGNWGQAFADLETGFGSDTESQIRMSASYAFTFRSVVVPEWVLAA